MASFFLLSTLVASIALAQPPQTQDQRPTVDDLVKMRIHGVTPEFVRQTRELEKTASSNTLSDPQPQVQLRFSASGVDAVVRSSLSQVALVGDEPWDAKFMLTDVW